MEQIYRPKSIRFLNDGETVDFIKRLPSAKSLFVNRDIAEKFVWIVDKTRMDIMRTAVPYSKEEQ